MCPSSPLISSALPAGELLGKGRVGDHGNEHRKRSGGAKMQREQGRVEQAGAGATPVLPALRPAPSDMHA